MLELRFRGAVRPPHDGVGKIGAIARIHHQVERLTGLAESLLHQRVVVRDHNHLGYVHARQQLVNLAGLKGEIEYFA